MKTRQRLLILVPTAREALLLFGERARGLGAPRLFTLAGRSVTVALTGCGLAAAGATSGRWFAQLAPERAALAGVAGSYDPLALPIGALLEGETVACDGIGAGEGDGFVTLGEPSLPRSLAGRGDVAALALTAAANRGQRRRHPVLAGARRGEVLSVAAAAATFPMAEARRRRHPDALVEEMEGYAVALAARVARVPLVIFRGACNVAGDREHRRWRIDEALAPCRAALEAWIALHPAAKATA